MKKIPCKDCLILPICMNKEVIRCKLLFDYLDGYRRSTYPIWGNVLALMRETLKGSWYSVGINGNVTAVKKNKPENKFI